MTAGQPPLDLRKNRCLAHVKPNPAASVRLFCLPYAGGDASLFARWAEALPASIEVCPVQLPGRGSRFAEPLLADMVPLVESIASSLQPCLDKPFALFGYSTGALVAFELARRLRGGSGQGCAHLCVAACGAPQLGPDRPDPIHGLPEAEFVARLTQFSPDLEPVFAQPELRDLLLPVFRADFQLTETYRYSPDTKLGCNISALGGAEDPFVIWKRLEAWCEQTSAGFKHRTFPGGHLFLSTARAPVLEALAADILRIG